MIAFPKQINFNSVTWALAYTGIFTLFSIDAGFFLPEDFWLRRLFAWVWILGSLTFLVSVGWYGFKPLFEKEFRTSSEKWWYLAALLIPIPISLWGVWGYEYLSFDDEGPQQIQLAFDRFRDDPCVGVYRLGYLDGYGMRQFILSAVPSYFFGHFWITTRLGNFYVYLFSYLGLLRALAEYLEFRTYPKPYLLAACAIGWITLSAYTLINVRQFEQSIMPLTATMLFLAGVLMVSTRSTPYGWFWLAWSIGYLPEVYRPALGIWPMAFIVLVYLFCYRRFRSIPLSVCLGYSVFSLGIALCILEHNSATWKHGFNTTALSMSADDLKDRYLSALFCIAGPKIQVIPLPLALVCLAVLGFSIYRWDIRFPFVCAWTLVLVIAAVSVIGTYVHPADYEMLRSNGALPFLAVGVLIYMIENQDALKRFQGVLQGLQMFSIVYLTITGIVVVMIYRDQECTAPDEYDEAMYIIAQYRADHPGVEIKKIYFEPPFGMELHGGLNYLLSDDYVIYTDRLPFRSGVKGAFIMRYQNWHFGSQEPDVREMEFQPD